MRKYYKLSALILLISLLSGLATAAVYGSVVGDTFSDDFTFHSEEPDSLYKYQAVSFQAYTKSGSEYSSLSYEWAFEEASDSNADGCDSSFEKTGSNVQYNLGTGDRLQVCLKATNNDGEELGPVVKEFNVEEVTYTDSEWGGCSQPSSALDFKAKVDGASEFPTYDNALVKGCWSGQGNQKLEELMVNLGYTDTDPDTGSKKTSWASQSFSVNPESVGTAFSGSCSSGAACSFASQKLTINSFEGDGGTFKYEVTDGKPYDDGPVTVHVEMMTSPSTDGAVKGGEDGLGNGDGVFDGGELTQYCSGGDSECEYVNQLDFTVKEGAERVERADGGTGDDSSDETDSSDSSGSSGSNNWWTSADLTLGEPVEQEETTESGEIDVISTFGFASPGETTDSGSDGSQDSSGDGSGDTSGDGSGDTGGDSSELDEGGTRIVEITDISPFIGGYGVSKVDVTFENKDCVGCELRAYLYSGGHEGEQIAGCCTLTWPNIDAGTTETQTINLDRSANQQITQSTLTVVIKRQEAETITTYREFSLREEAY